MRTLIVPCAGNRTINGLPIFLNRHPDGTLLAKKVIEGIFPEKYDRIIFSVIREVNEKYNAKKIINSELGKKFTIEVAEISTQTSGPAETVYLTLQQCNVNGAFAVKDSHIYINIASYDCDNFVAGLDLTDIDQTIEDLRSKSFIVLNEQDQVTDIIEKKFRSDVISAGLYGFKKASDFCFAYEKLSNGGYPIKKLYLSHIISYLIGYKQRIFHNIKTTRFEEYVTPNAWAAVQKRYATCFLDIDAIFGCKNKLEYNNEDIELLRKISDNGTKIIAYTSLGKDKADEIFNVFRVNSILCQQVVYDCSFSSVKMIISDRESLKNLMIGV